MQLRFLLAAELFFMHQKLFLLCDFLFDWIGFGFDCELRLSDKLRVELDECQMHNSVCKFDKHKWTRFGNSRYLRMRDRLLLELCFTELSQKLYICRYFLCHRPRVGIDNNLYLPDQVRVGHSHYKMFNPMCIDFKRNNNRFWNYRSMWLSNRLRLGLRNTFLFGSLFYNR